MKVIDMDTNTASCLKMKYWKIGFGLNKIDKIYPSAYLLEDLLPQHLAGRLTHYEIEQKLARYYHAMPEANLNTGELECDIVSNRIALFFDPLNYTEFTWSPEILLNVIHFRLFHKLFPVRWVGVFREENISKKEPVLKGESVPYCAAYKIEDALVYDFEMEEKRRKADELSLENKINSIAHFTSSIWQVHPFREGNTRTVTIFILYYLNELGLNFSARPFEESSPYFRNALVRANYSNRELNIKPTDEYLMKFFENVLLQTEHCLDDREVYLK